MIFKDNSKPTESALETTSVRVFDTKRTIFIRDGKIRVNQDANLNREQQATHTPFFTVGDAKKEPKVNNNRIYKTYPEKGKTVDYTQKIIEIAKSMVSEGRKLVGVHTATSYGYVNNNDRLYHMDSIDDNAKTFYKPNEIPFMYDHDTYDSKKTIGRVFHAQPIYYDVPKNKINDLNVPKGSIRTYTIVSDHDAIEGILDMRYLTLSSGFKSKAAEVVCSICNASYYDDCEHRIGEIYDGKRAYLIVHGMRYTDLSYVSKPADLFSKNLRWELVTSDAYREDGHLDIDKLKEMDVNHEAEYLDDGFGKDSDISLYLIDSESKKTMIDLFDLDEYAMEDIFGNKWKCIGDQCQIDKNDKVEQNEANVQDVNDNIKSEEDMEVIIDTNNKDNEPNANNDCGCDGKPDSQDKPTTEEQTSNEEVAVQDDSMATTMAALDIVYNLMETANLSSEDAVHLLKSQDVIMLVDEDNLPEKKKLMSLIDSYLDEFYGEESEDSSESQDESEDKDTLARANKVESGDAKLTTAKRKALSKSTFCGPNRSWPVPDCKHVAIARSYLGQARATKNLSTSQKAKVRACVNRKAKALGCGK